eukprot:15435290-Alexandrium_andersonii.AAC.1
MSDGRNTMCDGRNMRGRLSLHICMLVQAGIANCFSADLFAHGGGCLQECIQTSKNKHAVASMPRNESARGLKHGMEGMPRKRQVAS